MANKTSALIRIPAGLSAAAIESLGVPGSVTEGLLSLANRGIEYGTGHKNVLPEKVGIPQGRNKYGLNIPGISLPNIQDIRKHITEPLAEATVGKEALRPEGAIEEILQSTARTLPFAGPLKTGAQAVGTIGRSLAGSTAIKGAEAVGAPLPIQLLAGIGGERGFSKLSNWLTKSKVPVQNLSMIADREKNALYAKEGELGSKIVTPATPYKKNLEKVLNDVNKHNPDTRFSTSDLKEIDNKVGSYLNDFTGKGISADKLIDRRTELNSLIAQSRGREKEIYQFIKKGMNETIDELKPQHGEWKNALEGADAIHQAQNFKQTLIDSVEVFPKLGKVLTNPLAGAAAIAFPSLYFTGDPVKALATFGASYASGRTLGKGLDVLPFLSGEAPRRVLAEATSQVLNRNLPAAAQSYLKLNKMADDYDKKNQSTKVRRDKDRKQATQHLIRL